MSLMMSKAEKAPSSLIDLYGIVKKLWISLWLIKKILG